MVECAVFFWENNNLCFLGGLLGEKDSLDVWKYTTLSDGDSSQELVEFLVVSDGELQVTWDDSGLLVVAGSVSGQLENFSAEVFQNSGEVDWCASSYTLGVVSISEETMNTTDGELKSSTG